MNEKTVKKRTYICKYFGKYKSNKVIPIEQQRNKESKKTDYKWHVNLSKLEETNFVHITFIHSDHNHELLANNARFATTFWKFDISVMKEIKHAVVYSYCDAYTIWNFCNCIFLTSFSYLRSIKCDLKNQTQISNYWIRRFSFVKISS